VPRSSKLRLQLIKVAAAIVAAEAALQHPAIKEAAIAAAEAKRVRPRRRAEGAEAVKVVRPLRQAAVVEAAAVRIEAEAAVAAADSARNNNFPAPLYNGKDGLPNFRETVFCSPTRYFLAAHQHHN